jgi:cytoskeletal protein RodZ
MSDGGVGEQALFPERVGDILRAARLKAGLDLSDVASKTRVPLRHLQAIEAGDFSSLPSPTYCVGFVKSYARAVGEDPDQAARLAREEMGQRPAEGRYLPEEINDEDTGPVPTARFAIAALLILALVFGGYMLWRSYALTPDQEVSADQGDVAAAGDAPVEATQPEAAPAPASGDVVLTAKDKVWLRIYDASDKVLFEKEMAPGERYAVPADASNPMIRTGRADLLTVTVGGREVATLGPPERTIKDVGVSAAALAARPAPATSPSVAAPTAAAPTQP